MRVRFTGVVCLDPARTPGCSGQYNPGEEADLPDSVAAQVVGAGFAQRVPPVTAPRAIEAPPVDRALRRHEAARKSTLHREA